MRKFKNFLSSFRTKVTLVLVLSLFFMMGFSNLLIYKFSQNAQLHQLRERLKIIAQTATLMIDPDVLMQVPLNRSGMDNPAYQLIAEKLNKIKSVNPTLKYIYIMTKTNDAGILEFMVDPNPVSEKGRNKGPTAYPGDKYNASRFPEMLEGFLRPSADKKVVIDEWGATLSGYAPIWDKKGIAVAILGVDMTAEDVSKTQKEVQWRTILVLIIGILMSLSLGLLISNRLTQRIEKLVEGTRHIAADDLEYKVKIKGHDEITELATAFNNMATSLDITKKKLHDYFYRAMQSLVRILEAKDPYTCGHSERVAEYAEKIGGVMGFSSDKTELLKKAAQLHDIVKLAIHESILNKEGKLTAEEWKIIKEHPILGEEVLKLVLLDEEILTTVRSHHERCDGAGYPDKINGDNINLYAQIIAVADSYDAMTSPRPYRKTLSQDVAIAELKTHSGTQFNPKVVEALLKVLGK